MLIDLYPRLALGVVPWQTQQWAKGDYNAWNNCVPTSTLLGLASMGLAVPDPQIITNETYWPTYIGGETFDLVWADCQKDFGFNWGYGFIGFDLATIRATIAQGRYVIGFFHCDTNATIHPFPAGFFHASPIIRADDSEGWFDVLNVHDGTIQRFSDTEMTAAMAFGPVAFDAALPGQITAAPTATPTEEDDPMRDSITFAGSDLAGAKFPGCHNGPLPGGRTAWTTVFVSALHGTGHAHIFLNDSFTGAELAHIEGPLAGDERTLFVNTATGAGQAADGSGLQATPVNGNFPAIPSGDFMVRVVVEGGTAADEYTATITERSAPV